jgi:hypothetical protein
LLAAMSCFGCQLAYKLLLSAMTKLSQLQAHLMLMYLPRHPHFMQVAVAAGHGSQL